MLEAVLATLLNFVMFGLLLQLAGVLKESAEKRRSRETERLFGALDPDTLPPPPSGPMVGTSSDKTAG